MLYVCFSDKPELNKIYKNIGPNSLENFYNDIMEIKEYIESFYNKTIIQTNEDITLLYNAKNCYFCDEVLKNGDKHLNYNYINNKLIGVSCKNCHYNYKKSLKNIKFIYHNLKNYDGHIILKNIDILFKKHANLKLTGIPITSEKLLSFNILDNNENKLNMQFTDSYAFLSTSLSELSNNLKKHEKINTYNYFNNLYDENIIDELLKKGVYCYDYINNFEKLKLNYLPEKQYFYSKLFLVITISSCHECN